MYTSLILLVKIKHVQRFTEAICHCFLGFSPSFVPMVYNRHVNLHVHVCTYVQQKYFLGIYVGFEVMESYESPNIPFTALKTRFTKGYIRVHVVVLRNWVSALHIVHLCLLLRTYNTSYIMFFLLPLFSL